MTPGVWVAFAALMLSIVGGGVGAAVFIVSQISALGSRLAVVESKLDQLIGPDSRRSALHRHLGAR